MFQHTEASQTAATTPSIALPHEIVTNAADIVMAELLMLHDHRNKQYWKRAMHVIWEQLTHVHPLVEELPSKLTIPTHIIPSKMIMRDLVVLTALKEWPNFDKLEMQWMPMLWTIHGTRLESPSIRPINQLHCSYWHSAQKSTAAEAYKTWKWWAATRSMTPTTGKTTTSAAPSSCRQIFNGVVIVTPSWQQSGQQMSSPASQGAATSQSHLTTPSHPVTPNATPIEHMEEEITALWQQHMETAQDLLDTCCKVADTQQALADTQTKLQMLCDLVEALH
ncbi:hypothetical protein F5J12DRAFT_786084 [Pisolithus orientalis]|uniref:uncharacterized protein n=1 Tax=Pisolithus orientalis TaxID=936130 RepID=UPI002224D786|nr:uncharacterized protein F5J12DRAFT_786084 [Pisolithus orientalis]KAI5993099.1 hypothetical protein F5J12DRAFT_786084 [Pisolithus orientalis]